MLKAKLLGDELENVLTKREVNWFAKYWCDAGNTRKENLGEFIQRVARYAQDKKNVNL